MSKKIIFITGVTSGVGRETARRFIKEGWKSSAPAAASPASTNLAAELGRRFPPPLFRRRQA